jgi:5-methylcytosine-specific restriction endonuclease McrA
MHTSPHTIEARLKMSNAHKGKTHSPATKLKMSATAKERGFGLWMIGKKGSEHQKQVSRERWTGSGNPRWKGGVPQSVTHKNWLKAHPELVSHYRKMRKAHKRGAPGSYTLGEWLALKRAYLFTCPNPSCLKTEPEIKLTADHIVPVSRGGSNKITNIQPLCSACNNKKWATTEYFDTEPVVEKFLAIAA